MQKTTQKQQNSGSYTVRWILALCALALGLTASAADTGNNGPKFPSAVNATELVRFTQYHPVQPAAIVRTGGNFVLLIHNQTIRRQLQIAITQTGKQTPVVSMTTAGRFSPIPINLPAGSYVISEASTPNMQISLQIQ